MPIVVATRGRDGGRAASQRPIFVRAGVEAWKNWLAVMLKYGIVSFRQDVPKS